MQTLIRRHVLWRLIWVYTVCSGLSVRTFRAMCTSNPSSEISTFSTFSLFTLQKQSYSNILNIIPSKNENFQIKTLIFFYISAQNIDCEYSLEPPRRGGSNEYPQSMFLSRNKKNNVYPCKPQFYYIKVGFKGSTLFRRVFVM